MPVKIIAVVSDLHFDGGEFHPAWLSVRNWLRRTKPDLVVADGDVVDLASLATHPPDPDQQVHVWKECQQAAQEYADIARYSRLVLLPGNHEKRWGKALGLNRPVFRNLRGLDMRSQLLQWGLPRHVRWVEEAPGTPGLFVGPKSGPVLIRHGDSQSSRWGGRNIATTMLTRTPQVSEVHGHHHLMQYAQHTSLGRTVWKVANGHLGPDKYYSNAGDTPWQRGFTVLQWFGHTIVPHLVPVAANGAFAWEGRVWLPS